MLEESIPAAWASLNSWFTPTLLFVFLNLMIGTIAIASGLGNKKQQTQDPQQLGRAPSVLQRIKSINLYSYRSQDLSPFSSITTTTTTEQTQHVVEDLHHHYIPNDESETETEIETPFHNMEEHHVTRTLSDTKPASGDIPVKLPKKMRKSASAKSAFSHFEEEEMVKIRAGPATSRESLQSFGDDEEVDARADDFINKFRQELKLQRIDSILRYKEMLGRGADK